MVTVVLTGLKTSCYSRKTGRVVINFGNYHFTRIGGLARCRSTTRLPLRLFLLAKLLLGHAEKPFPFLLYFVDGSASYTNGINLLCNGFPCFSFGFSGNIVGKLALQDPFICLHVFCNYCQLSGSKIRFPFSFFGTVSGVLFWIHVYTDTEKF